MGGERKPPKRFYSPPSFEMIDANVAKAELKRRGDPKDANIRQMFSLIDEQRKKKKAKLHP